MQSYFYVEIMIHMLKTCFPTELSLGYEQVHHVLLGYHMFWLGYFRFKLDCPLAILSFVPMYFNRAFLHGDSVGTILINAAFMLPWHLLNLFFIHLVLTKSGFLFIESEVLRRGNESILDNLEEGVVILEEENQEILYYNAAAAFSKN